MRKALMIAPLILALTAVATPALSKDKDKHRGHYSQDRHGVVRYDRRDRDDRYDRDDRRSDRYAYQRGYRDGRRTDAYWDARQRRYHPVSGRWDNGRRGPPPWARGRDYRSYGYNNVYYVPYADYGRYHLRNPDRGYRWVRDDRGNFLLVAAATGIITSILMGHL